MIGFHPGRHGYSCHSDGCPLTAFATLKTGLGWRIALLGCRYCQFDHVVAVATCFGMRARPVAQWHFSQNAGCYKLTREYPRNPPGWIDLAASALPRRTPA